MNSRTSLAILFLVTTIAGCASMQERWEVAKSSNTIVVYERFLQKYPEGEPAEQAGVRLGELYVQRNKMATVEKTFEPLDIHFPETMIVTFSSLITGGTTISTEKGNLILSSERPWDGLAVGVPLSGGRFSKRGLGFGSGKTSVGVATNEGSEVRFAGIGKMEKIRFDVETGQRLCFRKVKQAWVYVGGRGTLLFDEGEEKWDYGKNLVFDQQLQQLGSDDAVQREAAARNIGWIAHTDGEKKIAVMKLADLLKDKTPPVRRGAAEGLGLIGSSESLSIINGALGIETDKEVIQALKEARAIIAGYYMIFGEQSSLPLTVEKAKEYVKTDGSRWGNMIVNEKARALGLAPPIEQE